MNSHDCQAAQRGLIGELIFGDYAKNNRTINALNAWRGHDRKIHDFFAKGNVEIKTTIKELQKVAISNVAIGGNGIEKLFLSFFKESESENFTRIHR